MVDVAEAKVRKLCLHNKSDTRNEYGEIHDSLDVGVVGEDRMPQSLVRYAPAGGHIPAGAPRRTAKGSSAMYPSLRKCRTMSNNDRHNIEGSARDSPLGSMSPG